VAEDTFAKSFIVGIATGIGVVLAERALDRYQELTQRPPTHVANKLLERAFKDGLHEGHAQASEAEKLDEAAHHGYN